jgi:late competence protein required for DNA uptake (superfamily II DNA/RNA helicase)
MSDAFDREEDRYLDPPEDPKIFCEQCGREIIGEDRYEIGGFDYCENCIDNCKVEEN